MEFSINLLLKAPELIDSADYILGSFEKIERTIANKEIDYKELVEKISRYSEEELAIARSFHLADPKIELYRINLLKDRMLIIRPHVKVFETAVKDLKGHYIALCKHVLSPTQNDPDVVKSAISEMIIQISLLYESCRGEEPLLVQKLSRAQSETATVQVVSRVFSTSIDSVRGPMSLVCDRAQEVLIENDEDIHYPVESPRSEQMPSSHVPEKTRSRRRKIITASTPPSWEISASEMEFFLNVLFKLPIMLGKAKSILVPFAVIGKMVDSREEECKQSVANDHFSSKEQIDSAKENDQKDLEKDSENLKRFKRRFAEIVSDAENLKRFEMSFSNIVPDVENVSNTVVALRDNFICFCQHVLSPFSNDKDCYELIITKVLGYVLELNRYCGREEFSLINKLSKARIEVNEFPLVSEVFTGYIEYIADTVLSIQKTSDEILKVNEEVMHYQIFQMPKPLVRTVSITPREGRRRRRVAAIRRAASIIGKSQV